MRDKIRLLEAEVMIVHNGKEVSKYEGDEILIKIIKPIFKESIDIMLGETKEDKKKLTFIDNVETLKPGDKGYIDAVLIEKIRNEMGMEIE